MAYSYLVFLYFVTIITPSIVLAVFYGLIYRVILKQVGKHFGFITFETNKITI
jgi:hypothetical protein